VNVDARSSVCPQLRKTSMALATLMLSVALFAMFFGLVAACDRI
jgi:hypothetical protein